MIQSTHPVVRQEGSRRPHHRIVVLSKPKIRALASMKLGDILPAVPLTQAAIDAAANQVYINSLMANSNYYGQPVAPTYQDTNTSGITTASGFQSQAQFADYINSYITKYGVDWGVLTGQGRCQQPCPDVIAALDAQIAAAGHAPAPAPATAYIPRTISPTPSAAPVYQTPAPATPAYQAPAPAPVYQAPAPAIPGTVNYQAPATQQRFTFQPYPNPAPAAAPGAPGENVLGMPGSITTQLQQSTGSILPASVAASLPSWLHELPIWQTGVAIAALAYGASQFGKGKRR